MFEQNEIALAQEYQYPVLNMGLRLREMKKVLVDFERKDIINRIWHKDYTVWKSSPVEIVDRLGWLDLPDSLADEISELNNFANEIRLADFHHIVLLGMGGSSLGPEVLSCTFGSAPDYPKLIVLDSTHPASVSEVTRSIELRHTLFLVSSKSGSTTETMALYKYFRSMVNRELGEASAGSNFVAITDPQTSLGRLAQEEHFRRKFLNPANVGGRYSVLSYFGLVPAALIGIDLERLIYGATRMQEGCANCVNIQENAGAWLGALIGSLALHGHNKLTFKISPSISSFGYWVEQLIAESTGKEGKGIIPIIDEPSLDPEYYGDDRIFIYLRLKGDINAQTDEEVTRLEVSGQPIIQFEIGDQIDLGAEFFRWEFATAVAGVVLRINPFDQPDVQSTKESTKNILSKADSGRIPHLAESCQIPDQWFEKSGPDNYLAIMAYLKHTPSVDRALSDFRQTITEKFKIATTLGYGPRFLHSTGQLHKGGPNIGLFMQLINIPPKGLSVPGEHYTLGELTEAEAEGDYQALQSKGRNVIRLRLNTGSGAAISRLTDRLE